MSKSFGLYRKNLTLKIPKPGNFHDDDTNILSNFSKNYEKLLEYIEIQMLIYRIS